MSVVVTGGAGYIGSHVCQALHENGFTPITLDDLSKGHPWAIQWGPHVQGNIHDEAFLREIFCTYKPASVIHLASHIDVRESLVNPGKYYHNNFSGTLSLLNAMVKAGVSLLVFSSSAAVYGIPHEVPIREDHPKNPLSAYGRSKWMVEEMLQDFSKAHGLCSLSLRYFNAAGADPLGKIGEGHDPETHLIPLALFTALKKQPYIEVYGIDHPTEDGTAIRDYIHVSDLAEAHVKGIKWLQTHRKTGALNIGTGQGHSVKQVIQAAEQVTGKTIPVQVAPRSLGDPPILVADCMKAKEWLQWEPKNSTLETILQTAWRWHSR